MLLCCVFIVSKISRNQPLPRQRSSSKDISQLVRANASSSWLSMKSITPFSGVNERKITIAEDRKLLTLDQPLSAINECHCGNNYDYDKHGKHAVACTSKCHNNNLNETCGGDWRLQIYSDCSVNNGGCQHHCNEQHIDEWCSCRNGYKVSTGDWKKCVDVIECKGVKGKDYHEDCHTCLNTIGSYTCNCTGGYKVDPSTKQKCIDINECEGTRGVDYHQDCHNCTNTIGSYTCDCRGGFELDPETKKKCIEVNECEGERGVDYNQDCHHCINAVPGYTCECNEGYEEDNRAVEGNCIDINECLGDKGVEYHIDCHNCSNTKGSYTCDCAEGYELHPNGTFCIDTDECQKGLYDVDCHTCVNLIGSHTCLCSDTHVLDINSNETCIETLGQRGNGELISMPVGLAIAFALAVVASIVIIYVVRRRRKDKFTSTEDDLNDTSKVSRIQDVEKQEVADNATNHAPLSVTIKRVIADVVTSPESNHEMHNQEDIYVNTANNHFIAMNQLKQFVKDAEADDQSLKNEFK
ncbi:hypothetical protein CAPTEDRAFT_207306, partial [Capitella teleta]